MGTSSIAAVAQDLVKRGDFEGAIPALQELLVRMQEIFISCRTIESHAIAKAARLLLRSVAYGG